LRDFLASRLHQKKKKTQRRKIIPDEKQRNAGENKGKSKHK
jgi:hypothetical protein